MPADDDWCYRALSCDKTTHILSILHTGTDAGIFLDLGLI